MLGLLSPGSVGFERVDEGKWGVVMRGEFNDRAKQASQVTMVKRSTINQDQSADDP